MAAVHTQCYCFGKCNHLEMRVKIVRSIDVGYRNTKYVERVDGERIVCQSFPSIAPIASDRDLGIDPRAKRNTFMIPVGKLQYEVGPEAGLAQSTFAVRNLDDSYALTDEYLALVRGALRFMRVESVDLLVVGLPVSLFRKRRAELEKRLVGLHDIGDGKKVEVARVKAMAQPMGGFLSYAVPHQKRSAMLKERNLSIDPGWRTFDWLVSQGLKPFDKRSDAANKGMYDVIDAIAKAIGTARDCRLTLFDYERIDTALRSGRSLKVDGEDIKLSEFIPAGESVVREAIAAMRQMVGSASDIDNILLVGGPSFFFKKHIEEAFPKREILQADNSLYANVTGFQIAGMEMMAADERRATDENHVSA